MPKIGEYPRPVPSRVTSAARRSTGAGAPWVGARRHIARVLRPARCIHATAATVPIAAKGLTRPGRAEATGVWAVIVSLLLVRHAAGQVELRIRDHPGDVGHAVGQA